MDNLIFDEVQVRDFVSRLFPDELKPHEGVFISLACRNKYLSDEQREYYKLTGTEMFARQVLVEKDHVIPWLQRFCYDKGELQGYFSKSGKNLPKEATTCYININPTDGIEVAGKMSKFLADSYGKAMLHGEKEYYNFRKMTNQVNKFYQQSRSVKNWIDVDIDLLPCVNGFSIIDYFINTLQDNGVYSMTIDTRSGFHVLMKKETVKFNYNKLIEEVREKFKDQIKEIGVNNNEMIPLPGCHQAGFPVSVVYAG